MTEPRRNPGLVAGPPRADERKRRLDVGVAAALVTSLLIHGALLVAVSDRAPGQEQVTGRPALVTRLAPSPQPAARLPDPPASPAALPAPAERPPPAIAPLQRIVVPQARQAPSTWVDVMVSPDLEPAIEAAFEQTLRRELPGAIRAPMAFETPPSVRLAPEVMGDQTQRMLRALVQIKPDGEVELVQTSEYDVPYMDAIRVALAGSKATPAPDEGRRWAILVFWFHRIGEAVTK